MKKYFIAAIVILLSATTCSAQENDAWRATQHQLLAKAGSDTARVRLLLILGGSYRFSNIDSALHYIDKAVSLARNVHDPLLVARALNDEGSVILDSGDIPRAYSFMIQSVDIVSKLPLNDYNAYFTYAAIENRLGNLFMELGEYKVAIRHYDKSKNMALKGRVSIAYNELSNIGNCFELEGRLDSAEGYQQSAYRLIDSFTNHGRRHTTFSYPELLGRMGNIQRDLGHYPVALDWYHSGERVALLKSDIRNLSELYLRTGQLYNKLQHTDSAFYYARKAFQTSSSVSKKSSAYLAAALLSDLFKTTGKPDSALYYLSLSQKIKDELFGPATFRQLQQLALAQQQRQQQLQEQNDELKYRYSIIAVAGGLVIILLIAFLIWRSYRKQKSTNVLLSEQKEEISAQRDELEHKNQELGIESALERVRTVAMGMVKPDDLLSICETMFSELEKLGFNDLRNAMINIHYSEKKYLLNYEFRESVGKTVVKVLYNSHPIVNKLVNHAQETGEGFTEQVYTGETLEEWKAFRKGNGEEDDPRLDNITGLYYYFYSIGTGSVGLSMFSPANAWQLEVLKRFRNVFDLAYKRYIDITNAAAQAHEAQIELGLERVRARAMAMQQSEELSELVALLIAELSKLDMALSWCLVTLLDESSWSARVWRANSQQDQAPQCYYLPFADHAFQKAIMQAWKERQEKWSYVLTGAEKNAMDDYMFTKTDYSKLPEQVQAGIRGADPAYFYFSFGNFGGLQVGGPKPLSDESLNILARFGKVFDLTYTRFNDLKDAEAQAREAQVQLALERVRARTMAMQRSDELAETAFILFQQFRELGENPDQATIGIVNEADSVIEYWVTLHGNQTNRVYKFPVDEPNVTNKIYKAWKKREKSLVIDLSGEALHDFSKFRENMGGAGYNPDEKRRIINVAFFSKGLINVQSTVERSPESLRLLERFAKVFEGTYTRFLDLQKAEAQAREAKIEVALERVRASAMSMHQSQDINTAVLAVFEELEKLDLDILRCGIGIIDKANQTGDIWTTVKLGGKSSVQVSGKEPMNIHPLMQGTYDAWLNQIDFLYNLEGDDLMNYYRAVSGTNFTLPESHSLTDENDGAKQYYYTPTFKTGNLYAFKDSPFPDEAKSIMKRFASVLNLTFSRFLDLQKAEAQAREAQIELALERVRSRALAMHKTADLTDVGELLYKELTGLGVTCLSATYSLVTEDEMSALYYGINPVTGKMDPAPFNFPHQETAVMREILAGWKNQEPRHVIELDEQGTKKHQTWVGETILAGIRKYDPNTLFTVEAFLAVSPKKIVLYSFNFPQGYLFIVRGDRLTTEQEDISARFTKVFELTYRRFLDLKYAEEQAREAQIEAALERVRSRSMGMQKSDELKEVIQIVFDQFVHLNIGIDHTGFVVDYKPGEDWHFWIADHIGSPNKLTVGYFDSVWGKDFNGAKEIGRDFFATNLDFEAKNKFYRDMFEHFPEMPQEYRDNIFSKPGLAASTVLQESVALYIENFAGVPYTDEENAILVRFGKVFQQAYTRFLDLQKAEEQARESRVEAALERVRSRTLAMQKSDELAETAAVLFRQMIGLGIEPNRLYIGIAREETTEIEFWITDEDGSKVSTMFHGDASKSSPMKKMYDSWKARERSLVIDVRDQELADYFDYLGGLSVPFKGGLTQKRRVQYISFFSGGFIGLASPDDQPQSTIDLLDRFAYVFNLTYARFNDLKVAEHHAIQAAEDLIKLQTEKKRAEDALTDLRAAQKQLVQSEKMASLGELTAGIAHEIQNPLNFVNNFSEVSVELLEELKEEAEAGNKDDVIAIADDLVQNLEKIRHHGKRADGIVKGMLEHSRASTGQKEPTDINALADEYFKLSYHGLRAKDKSFNAAMVTHFDEKLPKANVIGQDIGRVLLNLFNNAFYAVSQKSKIAGAGYKPEVTITTEAADGHIVVIVKDNGNGIPDSIKDKIMQPFFTTKPTGEGTGLGLSLSYDIVVKGHGGSIHCNSADGDGSEFVMRLPIDTGH